MNPSLVFSGLLWVWTLIMPTAPFLQPVDPRELADLRPFDSARFTLDARIESGRDAIDMKGEGAFVAPDRIQMRLESAGLQMEQIVIGQDTWSRTGSGPWQKGRGGAGTSQPSPFGMPGVAPTTPTSGPSVEEILGALKEFRLVEETTLRGARVRHYHGEWDMERLLKLAGLPDTDPTVAELARSFRFAFDLWVGVEDRYLHQIGVTLEFDPPPSARGAQRVHASLTMGFFDFDEPISIEPPDAAPRAQPAPSPTPRPAPAQAPAQVPRAPARLPNTGEGAGQESEGASLTPLLGLGLACVGIGLGLPRRARRRQRTRASPSSSR